MIKTHEGEPCTAENPDYPGLTCNRVSHPAEVDHYALGHKWSGAEYGHVAEVKVAPDGRYVTECPHGCELGESAYTQSKARAERRVELHRKATALAGKIQAARASEGA
jgi:hypothetical protein